MYSIEGKRGRVVTVSGRMNGKGVGRLWVEKGSYP